MSLNLSHFLFSFSVGCNPIYKLISFPV
jgi:hypothetical protein